MLVINAAYGEGGGQILRTALTLSSLLAQPTRLENIRAGRKNPGLAAQHLTAVKAAAAICAAEVSGAKLGSTQLTFTPQHPPRPGTYEFNVAEARQGGSAGAATLVLQTIWLPLALAPGCSTVTISGGTHVPWSPSVHYLREVFLPMAAGLGLMAQVELLAWGWYPAGQGLIKATLPGQAVLSAVVPENRGQLTQIRGVAVAANLPAHIAQRIRNRAANLLEQAGLPFNLEPERVRSISPGAGLFITAEYEKSRAGFTALGQKGKPSERVAEEAVNDLLAFEQTEAVVDAHLADQLIVPLALARQPANLRAEQLTEHTLTNLWVVEQFLGPVAQIDQESNTIRFGPVDT
jgi:RNA 3'-terminal phosphate cyclase (ATP)